VQYIQLNLFAGRKKKITDLLNFSLEKLIYCNFRMNHKLNYKYSDEKMSTSVTWLIYLLVAKPN
jgi:hypothetical protein